MALYILSGSKNPSTIYFEQSWLSPSALRPCPVWYQSTRIGVPLLFYLRGILFPLCLLMLWSDEEGILVKQERSIGKVGHCFCLCSDHYLTDQVSQYRWDYIFTHWWAQSSVEASSGLRSGVGSVEPSCLALLSDFCPLPLHPQLTSPSTF